MSAPKRGEIYWVNFDPVVGSEQGGRRPALIVQNDRGNEYAPYTVVVALSTAQPSRAYPFIVSVAAGEANLRQAGVVNCAHIRTVARERLDGLIGSLAPERMEQVDAALRYQLGLE